MDLDYSLFIVFFRIVRYYFLFFFGIHSSLFLERKQDFSFSSIHKMRVRVESWWTYSNCCVPFLITKLWSSKQVLFWDVKWWSRSWSMPKIVIDKNTDSGSQNGVAVLYYRNPYFMKRTPGFRFLKHFQKLFIAAERYDCVTSVDGLKVKLWIKRWQLDFPYYRIQGKITFELNRNLDFLWPFIKTYNKITCYAQSWSMIRKAETSEHSTFFLLFGVFNEWGLQFSFL